MIRTTGTMTHNRQGSAPRAAIGLAAPAHPGRPIASTGGRMLAADEAPPRALGAFGSAFSLPMSSAQLPVPSRRTLVQMRCQLTPIEGGGDADALRVAGTRCRLLREERAQKIRYTAAQHDIEGLKELLGQLPPDDVEAVINQGSRTGHTALYAAYRARTIYWHPVSQEAMKTMTYLLENGANPNAPFVVGDNLDTFEKNNKSPLVRSLFGVEEPRKGIGGFTLLHDVAHDGALNAARLLVGYAADVNALSESGSTPLTSALIWDFRLSSASQSAHMIDFLLQKGATLPPDYRPAEISRKHAADILTQLPRISEMSESQRARVTAFLASINA